MALGSLTAATLLARPPLKARTLGWTQMVVGLAVVGLFALGYHLSS